LGLETAIWFILPAYVANGGACGIHGKRPLDFGKIAWDGKRLVGDGVTWGGFMSGTTLAIITCLIQFYVAKDRFPLSDATAFDAALLGFLLGFGALFGDMVESFFKRRLGIKRGTPLPLLDQWDFLIGALVFSSLIVQIPSKDIVILFIITPAIHFGTNFLSNRAGLKDVPW